jgi:2'-hydroxyisoflavone reductase
VPWGELIDSCTRVVDGAARIVWVSDDFLAKHGVGEWMELPLWIQDPQWRGLHQTDVSRALGAGLNFRPLDDSVRGAFEHAELTADAGLTAEREAQLLQAWRER